MTKKYFYITLFLLGFFSFGFSQEARTKGTDSVIDGLTVYPNPNNTGKLYITTSANDSKKVEIYDVLGKKVVDTTLFSKELNVSNLKQGVYILKIKEGEATATRKLIIN
jgi:hypothetical protein